MSDITDPFRAARNADGILEAEFQGEKIPMILRHKDIRAVAKDWRTFSSDAPFRVPIPSEEAVRSVRQLPIETDPPEHSEYRAIVDPFFRRPKAPEVRDQIQRLIDSFVEKMIESEPVEVVHEFSLPIQSRALTYLLNVPESEADEWVSWGTNVFIDESPAAAEATPGRPKEQALSSTKGNQLDDYIRRQLDRAEASPGPDFFSALLQAEFQGRRLTREECIGFANLTFAGGRDTVINTLTNIIAYFGKNPAALQALRGSPKMIFTATEEFMRTSTPLTQIGRVCPHATEVLGKPVAANSRISLCWASANMDETVFDQPEKIRLDRTPNPHLAFGSGIHSCIGAPHARALVHALLRSLAEKVEEIQIHHAQLKVEEEADYRRENSYRSLAATMTRRKPSVS